MWRYRAKNPTCAYGRFRPVHGAPIDIEADYFLPGLHILVPISRTAVAKDSRRRAGERICNRVIEGKAAHELPQIASRIAIGRLSNQNFTDCSLRTVSSAGFRRA